MFCHSTANYVTKMVVESGGDTQSGNNCPHYYKNCYCFIIYQIIPKNNPPVNCPQSLRTFKAAVRSLHIFIDCYSSSTDFTNGRCGQADFSRHMFSSFLTLGRHLTCFWVQKVHMYVYTCNKRFSRGLFLNGFYFTGNRRLQTYNMTRLIYWWSRHGLEIGVGSALDRK